MSEPTLYRGSAVASRLGVQRSTISNWLRRDVLPEALRPQWLQGGPGEKRAPVWTADQLDKLADWYAQRRRPKIVPQELYLVVKSLQYEGNDPRALFSTPELAEDYILRTARQPKRRQLAEGPVWRDASGADWVIETYVVDSE